MAKLLYLDCFAGLSAVRLMGALIGVGADQNQINHALADLTGTGMVQVQSARQERGGFPAVCASISVCDGFDPARIALPDRIQTRMDAVRAHLGAFSPKEWATALGVFLALDQLEVQEVVSSPLCEGSAPHPLTRTLSGQGAIVLHRSDCGFPLITPLGAALSATISTSFGSMPEMDIVAIGYGGGETEWDRIPHVVRTVLGEQGNLFDRMLQEALAASAT